MRAILEGIAYQYPATLELISRAREPARPITIVDGEAHSTLWNDLKADVLGVPLRTTEVAESAALGAAILAGQSAGVFVDALEGARRVYVSACADSRSGTHAVYDGLRAAHKEVFDAVRPTYKLGAPLGGPAGAG